MDQDGEDGRGIWLLAASQRSATFFLRDFLGCVPELTPPSEISTKPILNTLERLSFRVLLACKKLKNAAVIAMFSPDAAVPASTAARNPRRRQRTGSDDSVALRHNPKRIRRSGLTSETFQPPDTTKVNGHIGLVEEEAFTNGHAKEPANLRHASADPTSLAIRHKGVKKADRERRTSKNDGSIELASHHAVEALKGADFN